MIIKGNYIKVNSIYRPYIKALFKSKGSNNFFSIWFLLDTGADRTFLPYHTIKLLKIDLSSVRVKDDISGIGGSAPYFDYEIEILFMGNEGVKVFGGEIGIFIDPHSSDVPILGRDILDNFVLIFDSEKKIIFLLDNRSRYEVRV